MTNEQKEKIAELRADGLSFAKIGEVVGLSKNTIKSYCRRNNIGGQKSEDKTLATRNTCKECGRAINQKAKQKMRVFCSKECREKWWHEHPDSINQKAIYEFKCIGCGKTFNVYGNSKRKYCSHDCYIQSRFGGDKHE